MFEDASWFKGVKPLLSSLIEPPEMDNVDRSFVYLHKSNMIASDNDAGLLTAIGKFAGKLPIDLQLSRLIALGITLNIGLKNI
jgi:HrpA-like RNA helicase